MDGINTITAPVPTITPTPTIPPQLTHTTASGWPWGTHTTCVLGGRYLKWDNKEDFRPDPTNWYTGIGGNDSTDERIVACCDPFPVHFAPPCLLWCEYDPNTAWHRGLASCMRSKGVDPVSLIGMSGRRPWINFNRPESAIAIFAIVLAAVSVLAGIIFGVVHLRNSFRARRIELNNIRQLKLDYSSTSSVGE